MPRRRVQPLGSTPVEFAGDLPPRTRAPRSPLVPVLGLAAVAVLIGVWSTLHYKPSRAEVQSKKATQVCEAEVARRLAWPTAPTFSRETYVERELGFDVRGFVSGEDASGTRQASIFSCTVTGTDNDWTAVSVVGLP